MKPRTLCQLCLAVWPLHVVLSAFAVAAGPAGGPFVSLSLDEAFVKAAKEQKFVFVDFYTTWCGPCKIMNETTWTDAKVIAWLSEKVVPLQVDAEKEEKAADKYGIEAYPTLLFLKADGTEVERLVGMHSATEFIEAAEGILSGKDALARAKDKLEASGRNNPMARLEYARVLHDKGKYPEALQEYLWCFDEGSKHSTAFDGVRLSYLLHDIAELAMHYPLAVTALMDRADAAQQAILSGEAPAVRIQEFTAINECLGAEQESLALYDRLKQEKPDAAAIALLRKSVMSELLDQRRYGDFAEGSDLGKQIDQLFESHQPSWFDKLLGLGRPQEIKAELDESRSRMLVEQVCEYYQILIGLKRMDEAEKLAQRLLAVNQSADTYNGLAWHGYLTGAPVEANVVQARKAYEMTQGQDAAIVDTLARVLHARGQRDEAIRVVRDASARLTSERDQTVVEELFDDLGGRPLMTFRAYAICGSAVALVVLLILSRRRRRV